MPILNDIIDWVENRPEFWQVAIDRLIRNNQLSDADIVEIKEICKADFGLSDIQFDTIDFDELREFADRAINNEDIILSKISNVENISALSQTSVLEFAPGGLTLVYGDNGAGKSSYVSVLKHTCNTRGHKPTINGNLYDPTIFRNDKKAEIEYTIDGTSFKTVNFLNGEINDSTLKSVDVFDTFSANHYIEGEDEIAFIPQGLSIVEKFALYLKRIENEINAELSSPALAKFDYSFLEVVEGTTAKTFLENLNQYTTLDELRAESIWDSSKAYKVEELIKKIDKLKSTDPNKNLKDNIEKIKRFQILKNKLQVLENALSGQVLIDLKTILNYYVETSEALKKSSEEAFSELPIKGVGNNSWKVLWESARKFFNESTGNESFPETNDDSNCPLCLQDLGEEAKQRFTLFEEFIKNDIQRTYDEALEKYSLAIYNLNGLDFSVVEQEPTTSELNEITSDFIQKQKEYLDLLTKQRNYLVRLFNSRNLVETIESIDVENTPKTAIIDIVANLIEENKRLEIQSIEEDLKPLIAALNQLNGEKKIYDAKPKLGREIYRQKKIKLLNKCVSKCKTHSVTTLSNELTTKYITQSLKDSFRVELNKLGFKNIKIETETKGERGKQYHFLKLEEENATNIALKDVLSEGEHRCISLATFLSELSISENKSAAIFDDPVSSLDHKWRYKISKRIVEESKSRQVIVFTHDITFLLLIQEHSDELDSDLEITSLTRKKKETGIIAKNPPWDALSVGKRIGILKSAHQQLDKIERTETEEAYKERAKTLYGKLRETWERFIEEVFLNGAIQRFGRAIQTQRLSKVIDLTAADYSLVDSNMSKCSTYFTGHDTAGILIEEMPDSAEFLSDVKALEDYIKEIRDRRR
ncbi:ATP-binding protein, AAA superfamily [Psychroflexus torquis ATCC 700755]|uniref:ATP-binding protein, AAA superfamily n=1 Tax=Psychroflexus torquis (strain ATCC 700755 / CIP 106069 / ACAM 623) TaxID=313595 RepID=K4IBX2_PSYTT|nr:AAA family ATPase [Psychroflexus torquis]AFU67929.1 ATP-binding protein, AAA superfamily [Psychroflexus torquis ATCC 700755]